MNRLTAYFEDPTKPTPEDDYWVIAGDCGWYYVSPETADGVARTLERGWTPRWLAFTDLTRSRVRVRARLVDAMLESTGAQRSRERAFHRARKQERDADRRPWEDDD